MVIIKLFGGLGNQMFQYAFSLSYKIQNRVVKYDLSSFPTNIGHNGFELGRAFSNIAIDRASKRDIFFYIQSSFNQLNQRQYQIKENRLIFTEIPEYEFSYIEGLETIDNAYLRGYWQNSCYFQKHKDLLRCKFSFKEMEKSDYLNYQSFNRIQNVNSVGVHIRRGDYLCSTKHICLGMKYYQRAIKIIRSKIDNPIFFIFSDDKEFATHHFTGEDIIIVSCNNGMDSFRDMQLMSLCKHNIIANSTFSWWAAWLNNNPDKVVIIPDKWFVQPKNISGLLLSDWIKLPV